MNNNLYAKYMSQLGDEGIHYRQETCQELPWCSVCGEPMYRLPVYDKYCRCGFCRHEKLLPGDGD